MLVIPLTGIVLLPFGHSWLLNGCCYLLSYRWSSKWPPILGLSSSEKPKALSRLNSLRRWILAKQIQTPKSSMRHLSNDSRQDPSVFGRFFFGGGDEIPIHVYILGLSFLAIKITLSMHHIHTISRVNVFTHSILWETLPIWVFP